jgi:hypothetical protein
MATVMTQKGHKEMMRMRMVLVMKKAVKMVCYYSQLN